MSSLTRTPSARFATTRGSADRVKENTLPASKFSAIEVNACDSAIRLCITGGERGEIVLSVEEARAFSLAVIEKVNAHERCGYAGRTCPNEVAPPNPERDTLALQPSGSPRTQS